MHYLYVLVLDVEMWSLIGIILYLNLLHVQFVVHTNKINKLIVYLYCIYVHIDISSINLF